MGPSTKSTRAAALALVVSGLIGCGKGHDVSVSQGDAMHSARQKPTIESRESMTDSSAVNLGSLPTKTDPLQYHRRLADELSKVNPDEGWESEAFTESASERMKMLSKWLAYPEDLGAAGIGEGFSGSERDAATARRLQTQTRHQLEQEVSGAGFSWK
jgi:hypothetical protein